MFKILKKIVQKFEEKKIKKSKVWKNQKFEKINNLKKFENKSKILFNNLTNLKIVQKFEKFKNTSAQKIKKKFKKFKNERKSEKKSNVKDCLTMIK